MLYVPQFPRVKLYLLSWGHESEKKILSDNFWTTISLATLLDFKTPKPKATTKTGFSGQFKGGGEKNLYNEWIFRGLKLDERQNDTSFENLKISDFGRW